MFKRLRIALLSVVLLFVVANELLTAARSTDWNTTLWVRVYPLTDGSAAARRYVDQLAADEFNAIGEFFTAEARRHGLALERPFHIVLAPPLEEALPVLSSEPGVLDVLIYSLRMRWRAAAVEWDNDRAPADIVAFVVFHDGEETAVIDRSIALEKGLIAVANLFADRAMRGSNQVVLAHELLHTLGATDKYDPVTLQPLVPGGLAEPDASPLWPQRRAELMAGRVARSPHEAATPASLAEVVIGRDTAAEIGWTR